MADRQVRWSRHGNARRDGDSRNSVCVFIAPRWAYIYCWTVYLSNGVVFECNSLIMGSIL